MIGYLFGVAKCTVCYCCEATVGVQLQYIQLPTGEMLKRTVQSLSKREKCCSVWVPLMGCTYQFW